ncbi:selenoprotein N [Mactra antiquata]
MTDMEKKEETSEKKLDEKIINTKKKSKLLSCFKCIFWTISVIVGILSVCVGGLYYWHHANDIPEYMADHIGDLGVQTFKAFDRNTDGYISIYEFEPLYHHLMNGCNFSATNELLQRSSKEYNLEIKEDDEVVSAIPKFTPLQITKQMEESAGRSGASIISSIHTTVRDFMGRLNPLQGYLNWKAPYKRYMNLAVRHFASFLPSYIHGPLGEVYALLSDNDRLFLSSMRDIDLSSNRYFPPDVKDEHVIFHNLLMLFHPRPFLITRFGPQGGVACIRARNEYLIDVVFRIHAEFQLNELPNYPFWFTPAQFTGHLIITKNLQHIVHFDMYVPNTRLLNVDMEWLESSDNMVVDIGYMPEMSVSITSPSVPADSVVEGVELPKKYADVNSLVWTEEITEEEAFRALEVKMYPFKEVPYYNFKESLEHAAEEKKLMHHILLWDVTLESTPVLKLLNEKFISGWSLVADLEALKNDSTQPELAKKAEHFLDHYKFPVMMYVTYPDGTVAHKINANTFLDETPDFTAEGLTDPSGSMYMKFLREGIKKVENGEVAS